MKKNILYVCMACLALSFTACSDDPNDAVEKHVYGETESPYLRIDASANIACTAEFRKGHIEQKQINLKDYAETFQTKLGMTVDDLMTAVNNGSVVFYNINATKTVWDKTAPNAGKMAWSYDKNGKISTENAVATVSLDTANKTINVDVPENSAAGVSITENLGFAINNGKDYDDYVRFNLSISVTDPGLIMPTITIPEGDYNSFEIEFSKYAHAIETCMGMTVKEFNEMVQDTDNDIALYMVETDGKWDTESKYTANGLGYWLDVNGKVVGWGDTCQTFVETHDGTVGIGRYPGIASGTTCKLHFVYASKTDASKFVEFIVNVTFA